MNAHNKMWQKQYRNISDVSEQKNLQYLKYSQWGRSWGEGWHQYVHLSMDFKATDVTINRQKLLKVIKHFQIPQYLYGLGGATVRHVKWSVKLWDSLKETSEMAVLGSV